MNTVAEMLPTWRYVDEKSSSPASASRDNWASPSMAPRPGATEPSVAKCAIYLHFASRRELIVGLQALVCARMMEQPRIVADMHELFRRAVGAGNPRTEPGSDPPCGELVGDGGS